MTACCICHHKAEQDRLDAQIEDQEAEQYAKITAALYKCEPSHQIPFFCDVEYLINDCASQDEQVSIAMCRSLMEAAKRGEGYALVAMEKVKSHYLGVV